jgi:serine/threonine-protein kinase PRP4
MMESFTHRGHLVIAFERLEMNLRDLNSKVGGQGVSILAVRRYATQLFTALSHLKRNHVLHADLKPDNILVDKTHQNIIVADFGSALWANDSSDCKISQLLVSRFYRPPEVIVGLPYDCSVDVFSAGCVLFELYTGQVLFPGIDNNDMLRLMQQLLGGCSKKYIRNAEFRDEHFTVDYQFREGSIDSLTQLPYETIKTYTSPTVDLMDKLIGSDSAVVLSPVQLKELQQLKDLLLRCIALVPSKRLTPEQALTHPFLAPPRTVEPEQ